MGLKKYLCHAWIPDSFCTQFKVSVILLSFLHRWIAGSSQCENQMFELHLYGRRPKTAARKLVKRACSKLKQFFGGFWLWFAGRRLSLFPRMGSWRDTLWCKCIQHNMAVEEPEFCWNQYSPFMATLNSKGPSLRHCCRARGQCVSHVPHAHRRVECQITGLL